MWGSFVCVAYWTLKHSGQRGLSKHQYTKMFVFVISKYVENKPNDNSLPNCISSIVTSGHCEYKLCGNCLIGY